MPNGAVLASTIGWQVEPLATSGSSGMQSCPRPLSMKLMIFGRDFLGGADKIALVFAVFGVHDDDDFAATDGVDRRFNAR